MKRALATLLALLTIILPVLADGEDITSGPDEFVPEILERNYLDNGNCAIAFRSMYDGETWLYNSDKFFKVASVYKLPLNMYFYELEADGELEPDSIVGGMRLDLAHYYSLEFSNNEISESMLDYLGGYTKYKELIEKYLGDAVDEITPEAKADYYNENAFTADMVLEILDYLYTHSDIFSEQIEHMLAAQPDEYLEGGELDCDIAQKYGYETYDGILHVAVAGIVYADEPFLITILTRGSYSAITAMGELCDAFAEWDAERISAIEAAREEDDERGPVDDTVPEPELPAALAMSLAEEICGASPLPVGLPWGEIFRMLYE